MTTVEILEKARKLISDPEKWTENCYFACDRKGKNVSAKHPEACKWSALGAIKRVDPCVFFTYENAHAINLIVNLRPFQYAGRPIPHADILALFDRAIELAKAEQVSA